MFAKGRAKATEEMRSIFKDLPGMTGIKQKAAGWPLQVHGHIYFNYNFEYYSGRAVSGSGGASAPPGKTKQTFGY